MAAHAGGQMNVYFSPLTSSAARQSSRLRQGQRRQRRPPVTAGAAASRPSEPGSAGPKCWYFAYGANLSGEVLRSRGLPPPEQALRAKAPADAVLTFQHRGGFATIDSVQGEQPRSSTARWSNDSWGRGPGSQPAAAADAAADAAVPDESICRIPQPHGMLYLLSDAQLAALARRETGYTLMRMAVTPYDAEIPTLALIFMSRRLLRLPRPVPPTRRYLDLIVTGAKSCGLADSYIQQLEAVPTAKPGGLPAEYFDTPSGPLAATAVSGIVLFLTSLWLVQQ